MVAEVLFRREPLVADIALVLLETRMASQGGIEAVLAAERLRAEVASPRSHVAMDTLVLLEVPALDESLTTLFAPILAFAGVSSLMTTKVRGCLELLVTHLAQVRLLT